jgi:hypothetical protein
VRPTGQGRREPAAPARPAHFLPELRKDAPDRFGGHPIQNLPHLGIRGDVVHPKDRLRITAPPLVLHRTLELQQTGMLKKHQRKATQQRIVQGIAELVGGARIVHFAKGGGQQIDHRF